MNDLAKFPDQDTPGAERIVELLVDLGVTHVVTLPDNTSAPVLTAIAVCSEVVLVPATREGEVIALASGLWLGGARPAVIIQNTGLLEAGDGLRGTAARMGTPLLMLVTCRGFAKSRAAGFEPSALAITREVLVRADLDSVAHMTESTLEAWGIPHFLLCDSGDLTPIREGWALAHEEGRPVAVLIDTSLA